VCSSRLGMEEPCCLIRIRRRTSRCRLEWSWPLSIMRLLASGVEHDVFARSVSRTTASRVGVLRGAPDREREARTHHVEARVFKDIFPRSKR